MQRTVRMPSPLICSTSTIGWPALGFERPRRRTQAPSPRRPPAATGMRRTRPADRSIRYSEFSVSTSHDAPADRSVPPVPAAAMQSAPGEAPAHPLASGGHPPGSPPAVCHSPIGAPSPGRSTALDPPRGRAGTNVTGTRHADRSPSRECRPLDDLAGSHACSCASQPGRVALRHRSESSTGWDSAGDVGLATTALGPFPMPRTRGRWPAAASKHASAWTARRPAPDGAPDVDSPVACPHAPTHLA